MDVNVQQAAALVTVSAAATWIAASYYFGNNDAKQTGGQDLKSGSTRQQDQVRADYAATITNQEETVGCCETAVVCLCLPICNNIFFESSNLGCRSYLDQFIVSYVQHRS